MEQITSLNKEQIKRLDTKREEWLAVGLSTEPADRPRAELAIDAAYKIAGLTPPKDKYWVDSPRAGCELAAKLAAKGTARDQIYNAIPGQHEAGWLGLYDFFTGELECVEQLRPLMDIARSCGWYWVFDEAVVFSERPCQLVRDERHLLHNPNGAAMLYPDGFGVWAWHGTRLPKIWVEDKANLKVITVLAETNTEVRRAGMELIGWGRALEELGAKVIDQNKNPQIGTLLQVDLPDSPKSMFLKVECGTGRSFVLKVPDNMRTAHEANAWSWSMTPAEYNPEVRT